VINGYLLEEFGERLIETISADDIDAYKEVRLAEGKLSNRTIVRHLTVLHGIFTPGEHRRLISGTTPAPASFLRGTTLRVDSAMPEAQIGRPPKPFTPVRFRWAPLAADGTVRRASGPDPDVPRSHRSPRVDRRDSGALSPFCLGRERKGWLRA
jgi:hypothetical protein